LANNAGDEQKEPFKIRMSNHENVTDLAISIKALNEDILTHVSPTSLIIWLPNSFESLPLQDTSRNSRSNRIKGILNAHADQRGAVQLRMTDELEHVPPSPPQGPPREFSRLDYIPIIAQLPPDRTDPGNGFWE
jgi:hypothetical protein